MSLLKAFTYDEVKRLLEKGGIDINKQDCDGMTALHHAAWDGNIKIVKLLLEEGAEIDLQDCDGEFGLHAACYHGHFEVIKLLLENGSIDRRNFFGYTALYFAARAGFIEIVRLLLENRANDFYYTADLISDKKEMNPDIVDLLDRSKTMKEWRPWTHTQLPKPYRSAMATLLALAKVASIKMNYK